MRPLVFAIVLVLLSACGAKGPLFLPDRDKPEEQQQEKNQK
jgi:predicted small lipoprotein YifL